MEYRVLGPLEVLEGGGRVELGGRKQRTVLALLVANAGHTVTTDRLVDEIYGEGAGDGARHSVQTYVSNLRGRLGDTIVSTGHAYKLDLSDSTVDSVEFAKQVRDAQAFLAEDCVAAARQLRVALEMWRGRPFQNVDAGPDLDLHITQLNELRTEALETRIEADLACGHHRALIGELEALTTEHSFRETFHSQLMLALYRSGRQAEALRAYQRIRTNLAEELGIDASPELRQLEQRILEQSPDLSLDPPSEEPSRPEAASVPVGQTPRRPPDTPHPRALHLVGGDDELEGIAPVLYMHPREGISDAADADTVGNEDSKPPPSEARPTSKVPSASRLALMVCSVGLAVAVGAVLYANLSDGADPTAPPATEPPITALVPTAALTAAPTPAPTTPPPPPTTEPDTGSPLGRPIIEKTIEVGSGPQNMFADESAVWTVLIGEAAIARIDAATEEVVTIPVGDNPTRPLDLDGRLWVPSREGGLLVVVDKTSLEAVTSISVGNHLDTPVFAGGLVWVPARADFKLVAVDPETFEIVETIHLSGFPMTPVFENGGLWVVGRSSGEVTRVDPFTFIEADSVATIGAGAHPPIVVGSDIWIVNRSDGSVTIIDTLLRRKIGTIEIGGKLSPPVLVEGQVWISDTESRRVVIIDVDRLAEADRIPTSLQTTNPAAHEGAFWAADPWAGIVIRIDPNTRIVEPINVGGNPGVPLSAHGFLWVPDVSGTTVTKISN